MLKDDGKKKKKKRRFKSAEAELFYHASKGHDALLQAMLELGDADVAAAVTAGAAATAAATSRGAQPPRTAESSSKKEVPMEPMIRKPANELELD